MHAPNKESAVPKQDEAAVRLTQNGPGAADYRVANVIAQYYSSPKYMFRVSKELFSPAPAVHGALVRFELKDSASRVKVPGSERAFLQMVRLMDRH